MGLSAVQSASAKAGQFSKLDIFSVVGEPAISSPYQPGGPKAGPDATFGYAKSDGPILAAGYENDVTREKAAFEVSAKIISAQVRAPDAAQSACLSLPPPCHGGPGRGLFERVAPQRPTYLS